MDFICYWRVQRENGCREKCQHRLCCLSLQTLATSFLEMLTSMTLNDPKIGVLVNFLQFQSSTHISRVNCAEMAFDRSRLPGNRNCYRLSRVSWALAQISCWRLVCIFSASLRFFWGRAWPTKFFRRLSNDGAKCHHSQSVFFSNLAYILTQIGLALYKTASIMWYCVMLLATFPSVKVNYFTPASMLCQLAAMFREHGFK